MKYIETIKVWYLNLDLVEREFVAQQVLYLLPPSMPSSKPETDFLGVLNKEEGFMPAMGLALSLWTIISYFIAQYESDEDAFLDVYNRSKGMDLGFLKEKVLIDYPDISDIAFALFTAKQKTKNSWCNLIENELKIEDMINHRNLD